MRVSVRRIKETVAADFNVRLDLLNSPARQRDIAWPRQYAMLLARELTPLSLTVLGQLFDRDHTTILTGIDAAKKRMTKDRALALRLEARKLLLQSEPAPKQFQIPIQVKEAA